MGLLPSGRRTVVRRGEGSCRWTLSVVDRGSGIGLAGGRGGGGGVGEGVVGGVERGATALAQVKAAGGRPSWDR